MAIEYTLGGEELHKVGEAGAKRIRTWLDSTYRFRIDHSIYRRFADAATRRGVGGDLRWSQRVGCAARRVDLAQHAPASIVGGRVQLRAPDAEVEKYLQHLDERIAATSAEYERRVIPEQERRRRVAEAEAAETPRRIEAAQRRLDERDT